MAKAAKAYRVYFSKTEQHEEGEDYLLDHSIVIYMLAPDGDFLDFYTQRTTVRGGDELFMDVQTHSVRLVLTLKHQALRFSLEIDYVVVHYTCVSNA